ncbi:MAG TPA: hypothetical protein VLJ58_20475 [Ramlibacter sp.]|nr:hypothetical protein [Ramlibacter sp.]
MSIVPGSFSQSPITGRTTTPIGLDASDMEGMETIDLSARTPRAGEGGLAGRTISVGDGQEREQTTSFGDKAKSFFKGLGKGLGLVLASPLLLAGAVVGGGVLLAAKAISFIPKLINNHVLEPRAETTYKMENATMLAALSQPRDDSVLNKEGVTQKLMAHAQKTGHGNMTEAQIKELVATGEHIAKALQGPGGDQLPLKVTIDGVEHTVESSTYTARAVSWYMMAQAASQDVDRARMDPTSTTSDMTTNGSFVMKDPGNRMYNFLSSAPTCGSRMSTHFAERSGGDREHLVGGLIPSGKLAQRGIEDFQGKMPGQGGTMLFDKLKPGLDGQPELFVKFESGGCPPYFKTEKHEGFGHGFARFFSALDRNIGHATSFLHSRFSNDKGPGQVVRQEHVYKGVMKNIGTQFAGLVDKAIGAGVIDGSAKAIGKQVHKMGLPYVQDAIATIREAARAQGNQEVLKMCNDLTDAIVDQTGALGLVSDKFGIERRGAESHIGL